MTVITKKQTWIRLAFIAVGIILAFFVSLGIDFLLGLYLTSQHYFKALPPNYIKIYDTSEFTIEARISSQGLRNPEVAVPKPPGTFRVLAVGDSFTFGWGVNFPFAWPKLLEGQLTVPGKQVEIVNAGLPGAGPTDVRRICRAYRDWFDVDAIILAIYRDDFYQAAARQERLSPFVQWLEATWPTVLQMQTPIIGVSDVEEQKRYGPEGAVRSSHVWKDGVQEGLQGNPTILLKIDPSLRQDFLAGKINPSLVLRAVNDPNFLTYILDDDLAEIAFSSMDARLKRFSERCGKNLPVAVVFLPGPTLVSEYYLPFKEQLGYVTDKRLVTFDIETPLRAMVERHDFAYFSVLPDFRKDGCPGCYYPHDGHLTPIGNEKVTEYLAPSLQTWLSGIHE